MRLRVNYIDGTEADIQVSASARHLWEQDHGPLFDSMRSGRSDWAHHLAHTTLFRSKATALDLLEWLDTVESVQWAMPESKLRALAESVGVRLDDETVDPTEGQAPPEPASPPSS